MESSDKVSLKSSDHVKVEGSGGNFHQYSKSEVASFANLINKTLKDDPLVGSKLPVNPEGEELFDKVSDGLIFAKLIEKAQPGTIDFRALNTKSDLNIFQLKENLNLVIGSAKAIGCRIISIFPETFIEKKSYLILGMAWQVLRALLLSHLTLKDNPYLARLLREDEDLESFKSQNPEQILIRWFNFHLKEAKHDRTVSNFAGDVKDAVNYTVLLNQLDKDNCDKSGLTEDEKSRAEKVIKNAEKLGVSSIVTADDILSGNPKLNLILTCLIYNAKHGLEPKTEQEKAAFEKAKLIEEKSDPNDTREERAFRGWANSLDLTDVKGNQFFFNNLYDDLQDSLMLLKILEKLGVPVDWKKVNKEAGNKFKVLENCKYAIECAKGCKDFKIVNIGGNDFYEKNKKLVNGLMWQMARKHTLDTLGGVSEEDILKWANSNAKDVDPIKGFSDPSLKTCKFLFALLKSLEERAIDWELVKPGDNDEEIELNCKYVISVCRRLNIPVFCVWEDIKEVKQKMIMVLIASIRKEAQQAEAKTA